MLSDDAPTMNILVPSGENVTPVGIVSWDDTEKDTTPVVVAVERSQGVARVYWCTLLDESPIMNILVPSEENVTPVGVASWDETKKDTTPVVVAVERSQGEVRVYWCTLLDESPIMNILSPSEENVTPVGTVSWDDTEKDTTPVVVAVERSQGVARVYWCTLSDIVPIMNILSPSEENVTSLGDVSWDDTEKDTESDDAVERSQGVARLYWCTLSDVVPIMNILVPSEENVTSLGDVSWDDTEKDTTPVVVAVERSQGEVRVYW